MIIPPDASAARPPAPPACERQQQERRPKALDPELEARLRRQRAQQYGRHVREGLSAWHARQSVRRQEQLAVQRGLWEAQRAARLQRLAEKQQRASPRAAPISGPGPAAPVDYAHLPVVQPLDAKIVDRRPKNLQRIPAVLHHQQQMPQQQVCKQSKEPGCDPGSSSSLGGRAALDDCHPPCSGARRHLGSHEAASRVPAHGSGVGSVPRVQQPQQDPLSDILEALLAAESGGDPFSIINLFIDEQLDLLQQAQQEAPAACAACSGHVPGCAATTAAPAGLGSNPACSRQHFKPHQAWHAGVGAGTSTHPHSVYPAHPAAAAAAAGAGQRPVSAAASDSENVSANVRPRAHHRRSAGMSLPHFTAPELHTGSAALAADPESSAADSAAEEQLGASSAPPAVGTAAAPVVWPPAHAVWVPAENALEQPGPVPLASGQQQQQTPLQVPVGGPPLAPEPEQQLEQQVDSSKQQYVQQWLQRSAAELVAANAQSAPPSTLGYSEDPDHKAAAEGKSVVEMGQDVLSSPPSSAAALPVLPVHVAAMQPPPAADTVAEPAAGASLAAAASPQGGLHSSPLFQAVPVQAPLPAAALLASTAAAPVPAQPVPPSVMSASSQALSTVTSARRPAAPEPPSSDSHPASSTPLSGSAVSGAPGLSTALVHTQALRREVMHGTGAQQAAADQQHVGAGGCLASHVQSPCAGSVQVVHQAPAAQDAGNSGTVFHSPGVPADGPVAAQASAADRLSPTAGGALYSSGSGSADEFISHPGCGATSASELPGALCVSQLQAVVAGAAATPAGVVPPAADTDYGSEAWEEPGYSEQAAKPEGSIGAAVGVQRQAALAAVPQASTAGVMAGATAARVEAPAGAAGGQAEAFAAQLQPTATAQPCALATTSVPSQGAVGTGLPVTVAAGSDSQPGTCSDSYSSDFDSDVEISYGEQQRGPAAGELGPAGNAGEQYSSTWESSSGGSGNGTSSQPGSPRQVAMLEPAAGLPTVDGSSPSPGPGSRTTSPAAVGVAVLPMRQNGSSGAHQSALSPFGAPPVSQQLQRPRSPQHALDDRYPGSPPRSPGAQHQAAANSPRQLSAAATGSRPLSPESQVSSRRRLSWEGSSSSHPGSHAAAMAQVAGAGGQPGMEQQEGAAQSSSTTVSSTPSGSILEECSGILLAPGAMLAQFGANDSEGRTEGDEREAAGGPGNADAAATVGTTGSPPGTPEAAAPWDAQDGSCPGSARVEDSTVVQTGGHIRRYLDELMAYFWAERAEAFAAGETPPLELEGYLAIERRRPAAGDPQHIFNKLLFDAANETLMSHYAQALSSYTGRMAPRLALLGQQQLEANVVQRVLRWAEMGALNSGGTSSGSGGGAPGLSAMLAEDALEDERTLSQLVGAMRAELAAAGSSRAATPAGNATSPDVVV